MQQEAVAKIEQGYKTAKADKYGNVVKKPLCDVLCDFCRQDAEFAQAVVQGGSFEDCLAAAVRGAQNHTPDIEIYSKAVQFFFPGAEIHLSMSIDLVGQAGQPAENSAPAPQKSSGILLDLSSFL